MSVHTDTMTHASFKNHELFILKIRLSRKLSRKHVSRNSAEKNTASQNLSRIFPRQPTLKKKIQLRGLINVVIYLKRGLCNYTKDD